MRIRTIKPEFWEDELIASWPPFSRLAYIALWNEADDEGRLRFNPNFLKSRLFPYDLGLNLKEVLVPLLKSKRVIQYQEKDQTYAFIPNFTKHQVISHPKKSKLPAPPVFEMDNSSTDKEQPVEESQAQDKPITESSMTNHGSITESSVTSHGQSMDSSRKDHGNVLDPTLFDHGTVTDCSWIDPCRKGKEGKGTGKYSR